MRLIDADALRASAMQATETNEVSFNNCFPYWQFSKCIKEAPTINAVPVVRGEWVVTDAYPHRVYCSLCYKTNVPNEEWLFEKNDYPKYCMWCGAKMEVEHETD